MLLRRNLTGRLSELVKEASFCCDPTSFSGNTTTSGLSQKPNFESIQPLIEDHINDFLRHKLAKEMPMIGMFIGETTITQLKSIFMKELEAIFPLVMEKHLTDTHQTPEAANIGTEKIIVIPSEKMTVLLLPVFRKLPLYGLMAGLLTGLIQLLLLRLATSLF